VNWAETVKAPNDLTQEALRAKFVV
jgi:hypothetical protein